MQNDPPIPDPGPAVLYSYLACRSETFRRQAGCCYNSTARNMYTISCDSTQLPMIYELACIDQAKHQPYVCD